MHFFRRKPSLKRPKASGRDWRWMLNNGGETTSSFGWEDVRRLLGELQAEEDSFLTMEWRDANAIDIYWFIQCAIALQGPNKGQYIVEYGYSSPKGPKMFEKQVPTVEQALAYFETAYLEQRPDFSDFRDVSKFLR